MNVACVTRHTYPVGQEIRVTKFASTITAEKHKFFVFCPASHQEPALQSFEQGLSVRGRFNGPPVPINPFWALWLYRQFKTYAIDVVIVRDLRLAWPTYMAAKMRGIKAILDLGEHYPGMVEISGKQNIFHYLTRNNFLIRILETLSVKWADLVWVVVDENKRRLESSAKRIDVINNFPVLNLSQSCSVQTDYSETGKPVSLISLGLIDNIRGLDLAIDAFSLILKQTPNVVFHIYGDGYFRASLEAQVRRLGLDGKVIFHEWISDDKKDLALKQADIGLVLHKLCDLTQHTMPNKVFDYMGAGLPVVSTKLNPVRRVLEKEEAGISVEANPGAVAKEVVALIRDVHRRQEMGRNGFNAVRRSYSWSTEAAKILESIDDLVPIKGR